MEKEANLNPQTEALINTFCEITSSSSKSQALFFLESHNFDLDSAVSTFLENSSLPSAASPAFAADPVSLSDSQSYSPSHSESSSPSRSRSPSPPPSLTSKRKRKPSNAYNLRSSRPRNSAAVASSDVAVGVGRRSLNRRPTIGSGSDSDEPQEFDCGGENSGKLVQDPSKVNDMDALFNQARQYAAVEGPLEHLPSSGSKSFTGAARRLTGEAVPSVPQPPENVTHPITCWRNGFTVDDYPPRNFDDPENASFLEGGALPLQDAALNVNVPLNLVGPIGVADPARNLVAERDQEAQRDRAVAIARCSRFEARSCLAPPFRGLADPNIETAILAPASNFPSERITYPKESTFIPCFISVLYYLNQMDHIMVSTKRWTDNCMGWVPPYSQIYISVLLYIQVIRAMDSAGIFRAGSRLSIFLRELETLFPFTNLWIPGPLVSAFKNLSCFWPSATGMFGSVSPSLPATPEWTQADRFSFGNRFASHLPNISIFISRLHSICSVATRPAVTEHLFSNDVDGPRFMATLFSQACVHDENELINVASPGASLTYSGGLRLWQNAAAHLYFYDLPSPLDISVDHVENDWISALRMNNRSSWLGPLAAMMAKYCQFWKSSCSLADCSPNCSATGSVRCVATGGTNVFQGPVWTNETGSRNNFQHGNANQVGHYTMRPSLHLMFKASTTIHDIPDAHVYPATTFHFNLSPNDAGLTVLNEGPFWDVHPPAYQMSGIQVYQGVTLTIARDYHSDTQIDSKHQ